MKSKKIIYVILLILACSHLSLLTAHAAQTPSGIPLAEIGGEIDDLISAHLGQSIPGAAVVVVKDGEIIFIRGYGYADIERQIPIDPATTVFELGSISKTFVWISVMQLVERGLLDLDADVNNYLPEDFSRELAFEKPFTMRELMNHAAGFEDVILDFMFDAQTIEHHNTLENALLLTRPAQIYEPGTVSAYSNFGTALAAYIAGYVSGQGYVAFERDNIFIPAGMNNTLNQPDWTNNTSFLQSKALGYMPDASGGFRSGMQSYFSLYPAGAVNGTAEDLARFIKALTPPQGESGLLFDNAATLAGLFTPSSLNPRVYSGTYHGFLRYDGTLPAFGHSGGTAMFTSYFAIVPEERFGFAVITNAAPFSAMDSVFGIMELLLGDNMDQVQPVADNLPNAATLEGRYIPMRRVESNFLEFVAYMSMFRITAIDENTITLDAGNFGRATYRQVEPYLFKIVSSDSLYMNMGFSSLRFEMNDGTPVQIHVGNGSDLSPLPSGRTMPFLMASMIIAISSVVFFLIAPVVMLVMFLRGRKRDVQYTKFSVWNNGLVLSGTLLVLNNLILVGRFLANPFRTSAEMMPHIGLNYVLFMLSAALAIGTLVFLLKEQTGTRQKLLFVTATSVMTLFLFTLINWNFFAVQ